MTTAPPTGRTRPAVEDDLPTARPGSGDSPTIRARLRLGRIWIVFAVLLVVGVVGALALQGMGRGSGVPLSAENPGPAGSKALVEVLRARGVQVDQVDDLDSAVAAAERGATVFLSDPNDVLGAADLQRLSDASGHLVIAAPGFATLEALALDVRFAGHARGGLTTPGCDLRAAQRAGALSAGQSLLSIDDAAATNGWSGCFTDGSGAVAVAVRRTPGAAADRDLVLVGADTVFRNDAVARAGNAALALGLVGRTSELAWYLPSPPVGSGVPAALAPGWVTPLILLGFAVFLAAAIWRGRRFGALVVEDLPVDVPAGETAEGRARLYARSAARTHALDQLRIGAIRRLAAVLRLPHSADVREVVRAASAETGRSEPEVAALLVDVLPGGDRELVDLAARLADFEAEIRRAVRPGSGDGVRSAQHPDGAAASSAPRTDRAGRRP